MDQTVTEETLNKYFALAQEALAKVKIVAPEKTHHNKIAHDYFDMATRYIEDAKHFIEKGAWVRAYGALNYAHGWLDAGARIGLFDVDHDDRLFTVE